MYMICVLDYERADFSKSVGSRRALIDEMRC